MSSQPEQQQQAQAAGKKGKKKKGKTMSLNDFIGDAPVPTPVVKSLDWADESEEFDGADLSYQSSYSKQIVSNLPTGPRASRNIEVDMSKLPDEPPFTAFVGNLPYEADEQMLMEFFKDMEVLSVRLPEENGRFKGYGYVEFPDKHTLAEALQHNEETFNRRQIRVDVAGSKNLGDGKQGNRSYGSFGMSSFDGPDVTEGEWRRKPDEGFRPPTSNRDYQTSDSYGRDSGGFGRDLGNSQGGGFGGDRGSYSDRSRDNQSRDFGGGGGYDKGGGYGYGSSKDRYSDDWGGSRDYGARDQGYSSGRSGGYKDRYESRDQDYGRDRYQVRRPTEESREEPSSRPQLVLQARTKPIKQDKPAETGARSSIFGGAKPVDTAAREKEIEEKLKQERENVFHARDERESFMRAPIRLSERSDEGRSRESFNRAPIRSNERSDDGQPRESSVRAPRKSSERSDEGRPSSPRTHSRRISSDKDLNDAPRRRSTSPGRQQEGAAPEDRPPRKDYISAPPPKQPAWDKPAPPPKQPAWVRRPANEKEQGPRKPSDSESATDIKKPTVRPAPAPVTNQWSRGPPKIESRGVREEAEGNAREDDLKERNPEGAADDAARGSDGSAGDGNEQRKNGADKRPDDKPRRQHGDGSGKGQPSGQPYDGQSDYRRRGDGGIGKRRDWDRDRPPRGYDDEGKAHPEDGEKRNAEQSTRSRGDSSKKGSQEKQRDSSRDSIPECDRSATVGQEQDFSMAPAPKGRRPPKAPLELEPEPVIEFVQKSKFSALPIEDEEDDDVDVTGSAAK